MRDAPDEMAGIGFDDVLEARQRVAGVLRRTPTRVADALFQRPREEKRAVFDPNSPFAALSALKEKLEADRKPGSSS